jgi:RIO kinase 1
MASYDEFETTFTGGHQECRWLFESLSEFIEDGYVTDVLFRVKGGKEATVYCCRAAPGADPPLLAAKVFRPRMFRAMRNDALYKEGRGMLDGEGKLVLDGRSRRALAKKTAYGRALDTASWVRHEYGALADLCAAGADVPKPLAAGPNVILMEFVGDEEGAAPTLSSIRLPAEEARPLLDRLLANVETFLSCFRVHADLSAYNVLLWRGEVRIIDLPQVVDALRHPGAFELFRRDLARLCEYFGRQGVAVDSESLARDLWRRWIG